MQFQDGSPSVSPGWNTFGPVAPVLPAPTRSPSALRPTSSSVDASFFSGWVFWCLAALAALASYLLIYGCLRWRLQAESPERRLVDRWLWCWPNLYEGQACCLYNVLFSPILLTIHATRIYLPSCLKAYVWRLYWVCCGCCSKLFTDEEFPPSAASLGTVGGDSANATSGKDNSNVVWVRAMDFSRQDSAKPTHPTLGDSHMCLFEGSIEAQDILQGALGDCWLLAAMATLAEHEGAINSLFAETCVQPNGKYHVKLFDPQLKQWTVICIDDFVPCVADPRDPEKAAMEDGMPKALYAHPHGREIWVMLLEKAFAKLCGSYAATEAGITEWAISAMTGGNAWRYERTESTWERMDLVTQISKDKRACAFKPSDEKHEDEDFFQLLRHYHRQGAVLCCGGVQAAGQKQGLVPKHAFSLLQVRAVPVNWHSNEYFRMVQIRNPWGTGEWKGSWCDGSPLWMKYPHVQSALDFSSRDDGTYWMQWEDFCKFWGYVGCVDIGTSIFSLRPPLMSDADPASPFKACALGCFNFWCLCNGCRHLFFSHQASDAHLAAAVYQRSFGCDPRGAYCRLCEHEMVHIHGDELVQNGRALSRS
ncbi:unnamed protein product [Durusdinium trenchii]|uniref:Calpain catalytic domain-containing protein n=1 Tax=Durusdinium trenchii TaxID=1381693 RepID=A0ABP0QUV2_9DINO